VEPSVGRLGGAGDQCFSVHRRLWGNGSGLLTVRREAVHRYEALLHITHGKDPRSRD
jgi:hypothetical protein